MKHTNKRLFFIYWVGLVTVTMISATMVAFLSMWSVGEMVQKAWGDFAMAMIVGAIFGGLIGLGYGLGQAIALRSRDVPFGRWVGQTVLAGAVGMSLGFTVMLTFFDMENMPPLAVGAAMALFLGLPLGLVQWQLLKPIIAQAHLWVPICSVAFFIGFIVGLPLSGEGRELISLGTVALLTAVLSGAGMVWLARDEETAVVA